jgi:hypothetical protein
MNWALAFSRAWEAVLEGLESGARGLGAVRAILYELVRHKGRLLSES